MRRKRRFMNPRNSQSPFFEDAINERPMTRPEIAKNASTANSEAQANMSKLGNGPNGMANTSIACPTATIDAKIRRAVSS
jgi:hypothetical protein